MDKKSSSRKSQSTTKKAVTNGKDCIDSCPPNRAVAGAVAVNASSSRQADVTTVNGATSDKIVTGGDESAIVKQLKDDNDKLRQLNQRTVSELSVLKRQSDETAQLVKAICGADYQKGDVSLEVIVENTVRQREELLSVRKLSERLQNTTKVLSDTRSQGRCVRCALRQCREDDDANITLTEAVQCTEPSQSSRTETRQVLLNDGRDFLLTATVTEDSGLSESLHSQQGRSPAASSEDQLEQSADTTLQKQMLQLELRDEGTLVADNNTKVTACPFCNLTGFTTVDELTEHIDCYHDYEDRVN